REQVLPYLREVALGLQVGMSSPQEIDDLGIVAATRLAMSRAIRRLKVSPDCLLIDALRLPEVALPQESLIRGDSISISIAAASIVAKVARDRLMVKMDSRYPGFGFQRNKGYGTPEHLKALGRLGPCPIHRLTFAPVSACRAGLPPLS
ncbi:MAG: ribonuclease HII, partial [Chloroflexi bacterium]|nr:ribonuclease HII [Chloroflexota bacterium]